MNKIGAGELMVIGTGGNGMQTPLPDPDPAGVLFNMTRDPGSAGTIVTSVALSPLPPGLPQRFTLVADF